MGKILQALADSEFYVPETTHRSPERQKLIKKNQHIYNQLLQKLNDEEKNTLEKLLDIISDENYYDIQNSFIQGYCLGTLMTMEIFSEQNSFFNTKK